MEMISFASVDRIEGNFYVCEVELIPTAERGLVDFLEDDQTTFMDVPISKAQQILPIVEGDILLVEHNGTEISSILGKCDIEKERRIKFLSSL